MRGQRSQRVVGRQPSIAGRDLKAREVIVHLWIRERCTHATERVKTSMQEFVQHAAIGKASGQDMAAFGQNGVQVGQGRHHVGTHFIDGGHVIDGVRMSVAHVVANERVDHE